MVELNDQQHTPSDAAPDTLELVRRARAGDKTSFAALFQGHAATAFRVALAILKNRQDAEDVLQETFLQGFLAIKELKNGSSFNAWLQRITVNRSRDLLRKRARNRRAGEIPTGNEFMERIPTEEAFTERVEQRIVLGQAIEGLPETHRLAILLYYGEGMATREVAEVLDKPEGTTRRILSEAYARLRREFGQESMREPR